MHNSWEVVSILPSPWRNSEGGKNYSRRGYPLCCRFGLRSKLLEGMGLRVQNTALVGGPGAPALPSKCIGVLLVLLFGIWEAKTQSEFETSSVYLWKTGKSKEWGILLHCLITLNIGDWCPSLNTCPFDDFIREYQLRHFMTGDFLGSTCDNLSLLLFSNLSVSRVNRMRAKWLRGEGKKERQYLRVS